MERTTWLVKVYLGYAHPLSTWTAEFTYEVNARNYAALWRRLRPSAVILIVRPEAPAHVN